MQYFVATTALFGITTCLLVGLFSVSRLVMVAAREWLLPPFLAQISPRTQTPKVAQLAAGVVIALLALLAPYNSLSQIVNFGALFAMWAVCNTVLYRRYYPGVKVRFTEFGTVEAAKGKKVFKVPGSKLPLKWRKILAGFHLLAINALSIGARHAARRMHAVHLEHPSPALISASRYYDLQCINALLFY